MTGVYRFWLLIFLLFAATSFAFSQERITTVGIQVKPIFPVSFLGTGTQTMDEDSVHFDIALKGGFSAGMLIRKGITNLIALEAGINYVKRTYKFNINETSYSASSVYRIIGYEIPVSFLVYIRLGEQLFMNASMGASVDMYASNVQSASDKYSVLTVRNHTFQPAVISNIGWEYRTPKAGFFYIGASFHRPFTYEFVSRIHYKRTVNEKEFFNTMSGSYLTVDFRYFFHEDPEKKGK